MARLVDSLGVIATLSIPPFTEEIVIDSELPDGLDLDLLEATVQQFYGDRFTLVRDPEPTPDSQTDDSQPKKRRGKS